ncbi:hypothetical protein KJ903_04830 [Patescibacteria group bacterium]|nr:hypothetical protein [Patescibacteria group bacterium]
MAYVLGFFIADGSMTVNPRGSKYLDFHITDGDLLFKIREVLNSNHKIGEKVLPHQKKVYRLQIGSKKMFSDLLKLGVKPRKTGHEIMPDVPNNCFRNFLRGYFDGDGNVWCGYSHKKNHSQPILTLVTVFTSKGEYFLRSIKRLLTERLELKGGIGYHSRAYRLNYSVVDSIKLYTFMYQDLMNDLFLARKKKVFEEFIKIRGPVV